MIVAVKASPLAGEYTAPPSKSDSHRALIGAALADGFSHVSPLILSKDMEATLSALEALDCRLQLQGDTALVQGIAGSPTGHIRIYCGESGSTLRFLLPIAAAFGIEAVFTGSGKLPQRPLGLYHDLLSCKGISLCKLECDELPLKISGQLQAGRFELAGDVSSQFVTGLLFALPLLQGDSELVLTSPLESKPYVDMTLDTLLRYGICVEETARGYRVAGGQRYLPCTYTVEGDYSNAAFFAAAGLFSSGISITGLCPVSRQGDREIFDLLRRFGASVTEQNGMVTVARGDLCGIQIDAAQIPDLVPVLAVVGTFASGTTHIYNAHRLKLKESDRLAAIADALNAVGAEVFHDGDSLTVRGGKRLRGGVVSSCNDHRIAMSMAVAALFSDSDIFIDGAEAVEKSYPKFFEDFNRLGGCADVKLG